MSAHPNEFLLRFALAIIAASCGFAIALALGQRWMLPLGLMAYAAMLWWGRPVTAWLLTALDPPSGDQS